MRRFLLALVATALSCLIVVLAVRPYSIAADIYPEEELKVGQTLRNFRLVVPHRLQTPAPLVFAFHGVGDSAKAMARYSDLDRLATRERFILVYPEARRSIWATVDANEQNLNTNPDVQFFDKIVDYLLSNYEVDRQRIYVLGMSNGASFAQLLAAARNKNIAAVAAHSGTIPRGLKSSDCSVPIMILVGEEDAAFAAIKSEAEEYQKRGRETAFVPIKGLGHKWSMRHNLAMWDFCSNRKSE